MEGYTHRQIHEKETANWFVMKDFKFTRSLSEWADCLSSSVAACSFLKKVCRSVCIMKGQLRVLIGKNWNLEFIYLGG